MKTVISLLVAAIFIIAASCKKEFNAAVNETAYYSSAKTALDSSLPIQIEVRNTVDSNIGGYLQALPVHYNDSINKLKKYPLLITLHGLYELGDGKKNLFLLKRTFIPKMLSQQVFPAGFTVNNVSYSFIIISPQFKVKPVVKNVDDMIAYAIKNYRVDTKRIYITGLSMGGAAVWDYASSKTYGKKIAAAVPICGDRIPTDTAAHLIAINKTPIWAFHNTLDTGVPSSYTVDWVNKINSYSPPVPAIKTMPVSRSHDAWTKASSITYRENGKNIYEWMLTYHR